MYCFSRGLISQHILQSITRTMQKRSISPGRSDYRGYPSTHPAGATQSMSHAGQTTMVHVFQKPIVGNPAKKPKMTVMGSNGSVMTTIGESASVRRGRPRSLYLRPER